jgi:photosystem II stability/assembly factor-like uncharacterized protein
MAWRRVPIGSDDELHTVSIDRVGRVWAAGAGRNIWCSEDAAGSFRLAARCSRGDLAGLWCDGAERLVACAGGQLIASDDGGASWQATKCRGKHNDNLAAFGDALWATNIRSRVLLSRDGGERFKSLATGCSRYLYSVAADDSGVVVVGSDETLAISRDGGATFHTLALDHRQYLRAAAVLPNGTAVLAGDAGKVHVLALGAKPRPAHIDPTIRQYALVLCGDQLVGVGHRDYRPVVVGSRDGGRTWTEEPVSGVKRSTLRAVASGDGYVVAVGSHGVILTRPFAAST